MCHVLICGIYLKLGIILYYIFCQKAVSPLKIGQLENQRWDGNGNRNRNLRKHAAQAD